MFSFNSEPSASTSLISRRETPSHSEEYDDKEEEAQPLLSPAERTRRAHLAKMKIAIEKKLKINRWTRRGLGVLALGSLGTAMGLFKTVKKNVQFLEELHSQYEQGVMYNHAQINCSTQSPALPALICDEIGCGDKKDYCLTYNTDRFNQSIPEICINLLMNLCASSENTDNLLFSLSSIFLIGSVLTLSCLTYEHYYIPLSSLDEELEEAGINPQLSLADNALAWAEEEKNYAADGHEMLSSLPERIKEFQTLAEEEMKNTPSFIGRGQGRQFGISLSLLITGAILFWLFGTLFRDSTTLEKNYDLTLIAEEIFTLFTGATASLFGLLMGYDSITCKTGTDNANSAALHTYSITLQTKGEQILIDYENRRRAFPEEVMVRSKNFRNTPMRSVLQSFSLMGQRLDSHQSSDRHIREEKNTNELRL